MYSLFKQFVYICLMNKGPQHLPKSQLLLQVSLLAYLITGVLSLSAATPFDKALPMMLVDITVMLLYAWLCLTAFKYSARFVQMTTALAGVGAIFQILDWPLMAYLANQQEAVTGAVVWINILLLGWYLAVYAHIFRESFNVRMTSAFVLTLAYVAITVSVGLLLFPGAGV